MGVAITELMEGSPIGFKDLKDKVVAVDAFNTLYQFLTTLRGPDGTPLQNSKGQITSHLLGLLSRNLQFLKEGLKPVFVFDGEAPKLKLAERERRKALKEDAKKQYEIAKQRNDLEGMRKYSSRIVSVDKEIIESSKKLLDLMGIPHVNAPSEGEAEAAMLVKKGYADYVISQDADSLLFGCKNLIRNLTISQKKKVTGKIKTKNVEPTKYSLEKTLKKTELDLDQFIAMAILVGTDFNVGGIKGLGPKKSLKVVKEWDHDFDGMFRSVAWEHFFDFNWKEVFEIFKNTPTNENIDLKWNDIQVEELRVWLTEEYEFDESRLAKSFEIINEIESGKKQKGLGDFF